MISGRTIVCIASSWDYDPTSKHHIMKVLGRRNDVLWVNYHGTRRPRLTRSDLRAGLSVLRRAAQGVQPVTTNFLQLTPWVIPGAKSRLFAGLNRRLVLRQIRRAIEHLPGSAQRPLQIWSFAPDVPYLVGQFGEERFVYYCVDDYAQFDGMDSTHITAAENELVDRADVIITTSESLRHAKRFRRPDCLLMQHGVDYERFSSAWRTRLPTPRDLEGIPRPIFGFFGLIQSWVDLELIAELARLRPHYSFVLIGECQRSTSVLTGLPNVRLLGRKPNAELPAYCAAFTAGLMPFAQTALARSINPIKMYEYLAAGLPVVSTPLPEAERFEGPIAIADSAARFAMECDRVVEADHPDRRAQISRVVEHESWESKVELLSEMVMKQGRRLTPPVTMPVSRIFPLGNTSTLIGSAMPSMGAAVPESVS